MIHQGFDIFQEKQIFRRHPFCGDDFIRRIIGKADRIALLFAQIRTTQELKWVAAYGCMYHVFKRGQRHAYPHKAGRQSNQMQMYIRLCEAWQQPPDARLCRRNRPAGRFMSRLHTDFKLHQLSQTLYLLYGCIARPSDGFAMKSCNRYLLRNKP